MALSQILVHLGVLLLLPPLLLGVIQRTKSRFAGRRGPSLVQPYRDLAKLARKELALSATTTGVFALAPVLAVVTAVMAGLVVPLGPFDAPISFAGDFVLFAYLLALGRFFTAAAALDTGSPFEGMGAAREVGFAWLTEPALFFAFFALARLSGSLQLEDMLRAPEGELWRDSTVALALVAAGVLIVLLAECARIPVDDPATHLELTMIHEVMVLDHSGPLFGLVEYGAAVKLLVLDVLLMHILVPAATVRGWLGLGFFVLGVLAVAVLIGVVESTMARLRLLRVPALLVAAVLSCGFALLLLGR
ncbi:MAG: Formate hydrogenlyase subunit 4 [Acidobacteria bacterium ADurb.Bin051]|nr:MAG: Formate hydrogenlyase subunit 4 [Acidobacteria bacterium ADurb.Bin051]